MSRSPILHHVQPREAGSTLAEVVVQMSGEWQNANEAIRGKVDADTPEEQAIADAWFAYWEATGAFHADQGDFTGHDGETDSWSLSYVRRF